MTPLCWVVALAPVLMIGSVSCNSTELTASTTPTSSSWSSSTSNIKNPSSAAPANSSSTAATFTAVSSSENTVPSPNANASFDCQKMDCAGENCYQNGAFQQDHEMCTSQYPMCWFVRSVEGTTVNYTSGCVQQNITLPWCKASSTQPKCIVECCNTSLCLSYPPPPTITATNTSSNTSVNFSCQKMDCTGERCYQTKTFQQSNEVCTGQYPMCWFVRSVEGTTVNYTSGCVQQNITLPWCKASSMQSKCIVECCNTSLCLTYPPPPTTTATNTSSNASAHFLCQKMDCAGENCYQNRTFQQASEVCTSQYPLCWFVRSAEGTTVNYTSGCMPHNVTVPLCNASSTQPKCIVECCNTSLCLTYPPPPTAAITTTTTGATTTSEPMSDRVCQMFSCTGGDCFSKVIPTPQRCYKSQLYCELVSHMDHTQLSFTAGCSSRCKGKVASCTSQPECFQECCVGTTNCLKLDGKTYDVSRAHRAETLGLPSITFTLLLVATFSRVLL